MICVGVSGVNGVIYKKFNYLFIYSVGNIILFVSSICLLTFLLLHKNKGL